MGDISTGDGGDMSPPLFKIPLGSPLTFLTAKIVLIYSLAGRQVLAENVN
jgi:hypothetical protein